MINCKLCIYSYCIGEVFDDTIYEYDIIEDSQLRQSVIGRQVGQVPIKQSGVSLAIIDGDPKGVFEINESGLISTKSSIDREIQEKYQLKIVASNELGFDEVLVQILVIDINDNLPEFTSEDLNVLEVDLRSPIGHQIYRVLCYDPDKGANGKIQFMLDGGNNDILAIDQETGIIELKSPINSKSDFEITVKVNDLGKQLALSNLKSYVVKVTANENFYTPMFDFDLYEVSLSELTPLNTEVITMSAIDQDQDDVISYAIIDNNNDNTFDILPNGKVYLVDKLDR